jgi:diguanylate cyclase (GGDEF)-like protein/PAS domain S-box-containing protein
MRIAYLATIAALGCANLYLRESSWHTDINIHSLLESVATTLAIVVGCLSLVRYYSKKDNMFLFIGAGFIGTACLDGYHTLVSSVHFIRDFPSTPAALIAWSWLSSRMFLAVLLWLSWLFWRREARLGGAGRVPERVVIAGVSVLTLANLWLFAEVPLPPAYLSNPLVGRPQEFLPAVFFLAALVGYYRKGGWKTDPFEHWLVLSLIVSLMSQLLFMPFSWQLYDAMFDGAHWLKITSYGCAMTGLLLNMQSLFSESNAQQDLLFKNIILATQQEVSPDAILMVNEQGRIVSHNRRFQEMWKVPPETMRDGDEERVLAAAFGLITNPEKMRERIRSLRDHRSMESNEELELKDGRTIDLHSAPMVGDGGAYFGRAWYFRDITERKLTERGLHALQERLRDQSLHDPLTGLFNRRYLDEMFGRQLSLATRHGYPVSVIICDIDHFKLVNDTHGHLIGDEVLRVLAKELKAQGRSTDIVCRYGGEEFLMVFPDMALGIAVARAESLRAKIAATPITSGLLTLRVTVSFGVACFPAHGTAMGELIRAADSALYDAKREGRNRVVQAPPRAAILGGP